METSYNYDRYDGTPIDPVNGGSGGPIDPIDGGDDLPGDAPLNWGTYHYLTHPTGPEGSPPVDLVGVSQNDFTTF